ncbi:hypothetical protein TESG_08342 [Trichophyton tonsurans CBS 112818]|uniref:Uncharacterized protein n=1 Tax=Trichophyton tonsurans (strain CBS 112818) TaxID=647933 RepID=F2RTR9_TRIT1|nr:hypothetical protein TESG_08342 [Trichophyton tonsurans CBS 112818]
MGVIGKRETLVDWTVYLRLRIREGNYNRDEGRKKREKTWNIHRLLHKRDVHPTLSTLAVMIDIIYICNQPLSLDRELVRSGRKPVGSRRGPGEERLDRWITLAQE